MVGAEESNDAACASLGCHIFAAIAESEIAMTVKTLFVNLSMGPLGVVVRSHGDHLTERPMGRF